MLLSLMHSQPLVQQALRAENTCRYLLCLAALLTVPGGNPITLAISFFVMFIFAFSYSLRKEHGGFTGKPHQLFRGPLQILNLHLIIKHF